VKKTVAYVRVSTKAQTEGNGPAQQRASIIAWASMNGGPEIIDDWAEDAESGTVEDREEMDRLKTMAEAGTLGRLLVDRADRLGRTVEVSLSLDRFFQEHGVEIVYVQQRMPPGPAGELMKLLFMGIAQYDRATLLSRMKQCKRSALESGRFVGGGIPYGYRKSHVPGELVVEPKAADVVRKIFDMRSRGMSSVKIAAALNTEGIPSPAGKRWYNTSVLYVTKRADFYRGLTTLHHSDVLHTAPVHKAIL
jgi:site-specific DNA recombinase